MLQHPLKPIGRCDHHDLVWREFLIISNGAGYAFSQKRFRRSQLSTSRERECCRSGGGEKHIQHRIGVVKSKLEAFLGGVVCYFLHT
jgi:hypothetical protein